MMKKEENETKTLLYIGMESGRRAVKRPWQSICLETKACGRPIPLHLGMLQLLYLAVPEYVYGKKQWTEDRLFDLLQKHIQETAPDEWYLQNRIHILLGGDRSSREHPPFVLFEAMLAQLYRKKAFTQAAVMLSDRETAEESVRLLTPYLSGINRFYMIGEESYYSLEIEIWLYETYGIVATYEKRVPTEVLCLNLAWNYKNDFEWEQPDLWITSSGACKFLDTRAKNGYNT